MSKLAPLPGARRLSPLVQNAIIRAYKVVGLVALGAILLGLIAFLTVNVFYLVNRTWIRPVVLNFNSDTVVKANTELAGESSRHDDMVSERDQLTAELGEIAHTVSLDQALETEFATLDKARTPGADWFLAKRADDEAVIERERANARREVIKHKIAMLDHSIGRSDKLIKQLESSSYIAATDHEVVVAFVPYENRDNVKAGDSIYGCRWGLVWCHKVGKVGNPIKGEVSGSHPHSGSNMRGVMMEILLDDPSAAEDQALFVGKRPFWIL